MAKRLASGNIRSMGYCPQRMILEVEFESEVMLHQYLDVPEEIWYGMRGSADPCGYFNQFIFCRYSQRQIPPEESVTEG